MISNREMFCTIAGVIVTTTKDAPTLRQSLIQSTMKLCNIKQEEADKILEETYDTLRFIIQAGFSKGEKPLV